MGDPAGIGPELVVKVLSMEGAYRECAPFVVGIPQVLADISAVLGADVQLVEIQMPEEAAFTYGRIDILCPADLELERVKWGRLDPRAGEASASCLREAYRLAMDGRVDGVVSAPLNKESFHMAGYDYADELAYLADWTDSPAAAIMGVMKDRIWTIAVAEHIPFSEIVNAVKKEPILDCIRQMSDALLRVGVQAPRIAVAALNVHAGEGGLYGREEISEIAPAIEAARALGLDVTGPVPADMVFPKALAGDFDGVVCMYHDQANIARKLQPMSEGATIFTGLVVPCGTTAHGTAFDKAGLGIADPGSLWAALKYSSRLASTNG
jgi:4-hydroxythreonine-4-phosphate dehydrogenase